MKLNFWRLYEGRSILELQSFYLLRPLMKHLPKGDGHPVIVFPGFVASDRSTGPMRKLFDDLGYQSYGWGLGRNLIIDQEREDQMHDLVIKIANEHGGKVSLVGWSLGGLLARELAKGLPDLVRNVITLGSPISGKMGYTNANDWYQKLNGEHSQADLQRFKQFAEAPPMPTTSIYSKTDGIVAWEASVQKGAGSVENIQVQSSHIGMGVNPIAMIALTDRLAQAEGQWHPFVPHGYKRLLFARNEHTWSAEKHRVTA